MNFGVRLTWCLGAGWKWGCSVFVLRAVWFFLATCRIPRDTPATMIHYPFIASSLPKSSVKHYPNHYQFFSWLLHEGKIRAFPQWPRPHNWLWPPGNRTDIALCWADLLSVPAGHKAHGEDGSQVFQQLLLLLSSKKYVFSIGQFSSLVSNLFYCEMQYITCI